jgi:predicted Zn-dependent protease
MSLFARFSIGLGILGGTACAASAERTPPPAPESFYTVTGELALVRHEPRVAALQYAAGAQIYAELLARAVEVSAQTLQPTLELKSAERWIQLDRSALEAHRAAAVAALELQKIDAAAAQYRFVIAAAPDKREAELADLDKLLRGSDNVYGAHQLADQLAKDFPDSPTLLRLQAYAALRADDPAAAVRDFESAIALFPEPAAPVAPPDATAAVSGPAAAKAANGAAATAAASGPDAAKAANGPDSAKAANCPDSAKAANSPDSATAARGPDTATVASDSDAAQASEAAARDLRRELHMAWLRARVLAGDADAALAESRAELERADTPMNRFDYCLLLWAARRSAPLREQLDRLIASSEARADALRVYGLFEFEQGNDDAARAHFMDLLGSGRYVEDGFYYLGLIAERHADDDRALRWYARVQRGDNTVAAVLRASGILYTHGAGATADELLDRLAEDEPARAAEILAARAQMYVQADQPKRAIALLDDSLRVYPDSAQLHYALASTLEDAGQVDAALRELARLSKDRPDDPAALNALGYTLADHARELGRARALIERAYAAAPKSAAIRDSLGWVLYRQGNAAAALPYLTAAYADDPGGDIGAHLGEVLWTLGSRADAERVWSEAAKIDADDKLLKATRSRLHAGKPGGG